MANTIAVEAYRKGFLAVLSTVIEQSQGYFLEPGSSLFDTLASVSAEEASRPIGGNGSTLAAQVNHVRFYIVTRNDEISSGEERPVDWAAAWQTGVVTDTEWRMLIEGLRAAYEQFISFARSFEDWDEWMIADAFALLGHCAYHLGEIRQGLGLLRA
jgi:hypothetical protein